MGEEIPNRVYAVEQVKEEDEETDNNNSPRKPVFLDKDMPKKSRNFNTNTKTKSFGMSYYDTSDEETANNKGFKSQDTKPTTKLNTQSRLSQLSKFNLFALVELANACLVIKTQGNVEYAMQILNESIMSCRILSEKAGAQIIAQELLELLSNQIMDYKTQELELEDDPSVVYQAEISPKFQNEQQSEVAKGQVMAASTPVQDVATDLKGRNNSGIDITDDEPVKPDINRTKLNCRGIICSQDFHTVMAITTLVPFIKSGIPRLSEYEVRRAKLIEKDKKVKNYPVRPFINNLNLRYEIDQMETEVAETMTMTPIRENEASESPQAPASKILISDDKDENNNIQDHADLNLSEFKNSNNISGTDLGLGSRDLNRRKSKANSRYSRGHTASDTNGINNGKIVSKSNLQVYTLYNQKLAKRAIITPQYG